MQTKSLWKLGLSVLLLPALVTGGCKALAGPEPAGFVAWQKMHKNDPRFPFQLVWIDPQYDAEHRSYGSLVVAAVDTQHMIHKPWYEGVRTAYSFSDYQKDLAVFSDFIRKTVEEEFRNDPKHRFRVVDRPEADSVIVELALVELIPAEPALAAAGLVVPGASLMSDPSVGMEGRVRVSKTNQVVATFAFRDQPPWAAVDITSFRSWFDADKDVIRKWAKLSVLAANREYDADKQSKLPFKLVSW